LPWPGFWTRRSKFKTAIRYQTRSGRVFASEQTWIYAAPSPHARARSRTGSGRAVGRRAARVAEAAGAPRGRRCVSTISRYCFMYIQLRLPSPLHPNEARPAHAPRTPLLRDSAEIKEEEDGASPRSPLPQVALRRTLRATATSGCDRASNAMRLCTALASSANNTRATCENSFHRERHLHNVCAHRWHHQQTTCSMPAPG
jgi:hypothetical protein